MVDKKWETFKAFCEVCEETENQLGDFNKRLEEVLGNDARVMIDWPVDSVNNMLRIYMIGVMECTPEEVEWFIYESGLLNGYLKEGESTYVYPDKETCFEITSIKDYYDYLCNDYSNLKKVDSPYESLSDAAVYGCLTIGKDGFKFEVTNADK